MNFYIYYCQYIHNGMSSIKMIICLCRQYRAYSSDFAAVDMYRSDCFRSASALSLIPLREHFIQTEM